VTTQVTGARRELLDFMVQGKINRGRHTDRPVGATSSGLTSAHLLILTRGHESQTVNLLSTASFLILMKQEITGRQWHQLDRMQIFCTSVQTDNMPVPHHSIFLHAGCSCWCPTNCKLTEHCKFLAVMSIHLSFCLYAFIMHPLFTISNNVNSNIAETAWKYHRQHVSVTYQSRDSVCLTIQSTPTLASSYLLDAVRKLLLGILTKVNHGLLHQRCSDTASTYSPFTP